MRQWCLQALQLLGASVRPGEPAKLPQGEDTGTLRTCARAVPWQSRHTGKRSGQSSAGVASCQTGASKGVASISWPCGAHKHAERSALQSVYRPHADRLVMPGSSLVTASLVFTAAVRGCCTGPHADGLVRPGTERCYRVGAPCCLHAPPLACCPRQHFVSHFLLLWPQQGRKLAQTARETPPGSCSTVQEMRGFT